MGIMILPFTETTVVYAGLAFAKEASPMELVNVILICLG